MDYEKKIKKLNVIKKLLEKELITVKKNIGESEVVKEVNEELRAFLTAQIEIILNSRVTYPSSTGTTTESFFSPDEAAVLKQLAAKVLKRAENEESSGMAVIDIEAKPPETPTPRVSKGHGPVWAALQSAGYDPETFKSLPVEERKEVMKQIEKNRKGN